MRTKDLIDLADNPDFISGIYNYCDRWCERCPFTSRCFLYATEKEDEADDPDTLDIRNAAFWEKLHSIFQQTHEMIVAWAEASGVDLTAVAADPADYEKERANARSNELAVAAENYAWAVNKWFEEELGIESSDDSGVEPTESSEVKESIDDATAVIRWYQFQIAAKTIRALTSRQDHFETNEEIDAKDSDGSAKVALIAMDRSISAWRIMQLCLPDNANSINHLLVALERLRLGVERTFPNARDFIRPGFDEVAHDLIQ